MDKELLNKLSQISLSKEDREQIEKVNESNKKYWKDLAEYRRDCYMRQTDKYKNYSFTKITHDKQTYNTKDSLMFKVEDNGIQVQLDTIKRDEAQLAAYSSPAAREGAEAGEKLREMEKRFAKLSGISSHAAIHDILSGQKKAEEVKISDSMLKKTSWRDRLLNKVGIKTKTTKHNDELKALFEQQKQAAASFLNYPDAENLHRLNQDFDIQSLRLENQSFLEKKVNKDYYTLKVSMYSNQLASNAFEEINRETQERFPSMTGNRLHNLAKEKREKLAIGKEIGLRTEARQTTGIKDIQNNTGVDKLAEKAVATQGMSSQEIYQMRKEQLMASR